MRITISRHVRRGSISTVPCLILCCKARAKRLYKFTLFAIERHARIYTGMRIWRSIKRVLSAGGRALFCELERIIRRSRRTWNINPLLATGQLSVYIRVCCTISEIFAFNSYLYANHILQIVTSSVLNIFMEASLLCSPLFSIIEKTFQIDNFLLI